MGERQGGKEAVAGGLGHPSGPVKRSCCHRIQVDGECLARSFVRDGVYSGLSLEEPIEKKVFRLSKQSTITS